MRNTKVCPKCGGRKIGHLASLPDTVADETLAVPRMLGTTTVDGKRTKVGIIEAYVCAGCGYLEEYVAAVHGVPLEELEGFSWEREGAPYR